MTKSERIRVGEALDALRDALAPFIDRAMTNAYGPEWDKRVAEEDAKRRSNGRRWPVSKTDLAVLLKRIQFEKIEPWWPESSRPNPRVRAFASEILTLRNEHAHGNECIGEHARLLDTASRLLRTLDLAVPPELESEATHSKDGSAGLQASRTIAAASIASTGFEQEIAKLGKPGERIVERLVQSFEVKRRIDAVTKAIPLKRPEQAIVIALAEDVVPEVLGLVAELQSIAAASDATVIRAFALAAQCETLDSDDVILALATLRITATQVAPALSLDSRFLESLEAAASAIERNDTAAANRRLSELKRHSEVHREDSEQFWAEFDRRQQDLHHLEMLVDRRLDDWREVARLALALPDSEELPNYLLVMAHSALQRDEEGEVALELVRDSIPRLRMLAARAPGTHMESALVATLRREGQLLNDLDRPDEAIRAFARADEIIDRYPVADPSLS